MHPMLMFAAAQTLLFQRPGYLADSCFDTQNGVMDAHFGGKSERGKQRGRCSISATRPHVGPPLLAAAHMPVNDELVAKLTSF